MKASYLLALLIGGFLLAGCGGESEAEADDVSVGDVSTKQALSIGFVGSTGQPVAEVVARLAELELRRPAVVTEVIPTTGSEASSLFDGYDLVIDSAGYTSRKYVEANQEELGGEIEPSAFMLQNFVGDGYRVVELEAVTQRRLSALPVGDQESLTWDDLVLPETLELYAEESPVEQDLPAPIRVMSVGELESEYVELFAELGLEITSEQFATTEDLGETLDGLRADSRGAFVATASPDLLARNAGLVIVDPPCVEACIGQENEIALVVGPETPTDSIPLLSDIRLTDDELGSLLSTFTETEDPSQTADSWLSQNTAVWQPWVASS